MNYTKGEWEASKTLNFTGTLVSYITCGNKTIAQTRLSDNEDTKEENQANAQLIASAPDMYEALLVAKGNMEALHVDPQDPMYLEIKKALAKAEGK